MNFLANLACLLGGFAIGVSCGYFWRARIASKVAEVSEDIKRHL